MTVLKVLRAQLSGIRVADFDRHAEQSVIYEKTMRERNRMLKDGVRDPSWYSAVEKQMAEAGAIIESNRVMTVARLQEAQEGADMAFPAAELSLVGAQAGVVITDKDDLLTAFVESRPRDMAAGRTLVGPHRDDLLAVYTAKGTPAKQMLHWRTKSPACVPYPCKWPRLGARFRGTANLFTGRGCSPSGCRPPRRTL